MPLMKIDVKVLSGAALALIGVGVGTGMALHSSPASTPRPMMVQQVAATSVARRPVVKPVVKRSVSAVKLVPHVVTVKPQTAPKAIQQDVVPPSQEASPVSSPSTDASTPAPAPADTTPSQTAPSNDVTQGPNGGPLPVAAAPVPPPPLKK